MSAGAEVRDEALGFDSHLAEKARREFLTFRLGEETYGIDILQVQEIREIEAVTRVPHVAAYTRGVINLRGAIVPVVDLGLMLGFGEPLALEGASAIVLHAEGRLVGLVVASVSDVIALADDEIRPPPTLDNHAVARAIAGIGMRAGEERASVLLLDAEHVLRRIREERA
jgi:purine-binding chemotaxis protein CheW